MKWLECLKDLLFPRRCEICGRLLPLDWEYMCGDCLEDLPLTYYWDWEGNPAEKKLWVRTYLHRVVPLFFYTRESKYISLIHKIKYQGNIRLGHYMGKMLGEKIKTALPDIDYIVPIPLHPIRRWRRGYNQAEVIARGVAEVLFGREAANIHLLTYALKRKKYTRTQTRQRMDQKWGNVSDAFKVRTPAPLAGKHILIIDDVLTTGATAESAYTAIVKECRDCKVSFASLGYVE